VTEITAVEKKRQGIMSARIQFSTLHDRIVRGPSPSWNCATTRQLTWCRVCRIACVVSCRVVSCRVVSCRVFCLCGVGT
jgi:hypothetical protein